MLTISQPGYSGVFTETNTCDPSVAQISANLSKGPSATFTVSGASQTGTCSAYFSGGHGKTITVAIIIAPAGLSIDASRSSTSQ